MTAMGDCEVIIRKIYAFNVAFADLRIAVRDFVEHLNVPGRYVMITRAVFVLRTITLSIEDLLSGALAPSPNVIGEYF
jgi:hypothetical protein